MSDIVPDRLTAFAFFAPFSAKQRAHLAEQAVQLRFPAQTAIFHAGEHSDTMYAILDGRVKIWRDDESGGEIVLSLLEAGQAFGELAMLTGEPRLASASTLTACDCLIIDRALLAQAIMVGTPDDVLGMLGALSRQIRETNEREFQDLLIKRTQELQREIQLLRIEIDQVRRQQQVQEIVDSDFFQNMHAQAQALRARRGTDGPSAPADTDNP